MYNSIVHQLYIVFLSCDALNLPCACVVQGSARDLGRVIQRFWGSPTLALSFLDSFPNCPISAVSLKYVLYSLMPERLWVSFWSFSLCVQCQLQCILKAVKVRKFSLCHSLLPSVNVPPESPCFSLLCWDLRQFFFIFF